MTVGWAIKRADGTYRCWNAHTQDDVIQPGEVWESWDTPPIITVPPRPPNPLIAQINAAIASTATSPEIRALLATWKTQL